MYVASSIKKVRAKVKNEPEESHLFHHLWHNYDILNDIAYGQTAPSKKRIH
jgi:hypothetical protein